MDEKQRYTFDIFVAFLTPVDTLTNSALAEANLSQYLFHKSKTGFGNIKRRCQIVLSMLQLINYMMVLMSLLEFIFMFCNQRVSSKERKISEIYENPIAEHSEQWLRWGIFYCNNLKRRVTKGHN